MEISKETFKEADADTKMNIMFDIMKSTHDCVKGNGDCGLQESVSKIQTSMKWTQRFLFILASLLGIK